MSSGNLQFFQLEEADLIRAAALAVPRRKIDPFGIPDFLFEAEDYLEALDIAAAGFASSMAHAVSTRHSALELSRQAAETRRTLDAAIDLIGGYPAQAFAGQKEPQTISEYQNLQAWAEEMFFTGRWNPGSAASAFTWLRLKRDVIIDDSSFFIERKATQYKASAGALSLRDQYLNVVIRTYAGLREMELEAVKWSREGRLSKWVQVCCDPVFRRIDGRALSIEGYGRQVRAVLASHRVQKTSKARKSAP